MNISVYIALSLDGFIARTDGIYFGPFVPTPAVYRSDHESQAFTRDDRAYTPL
jgi:hypothetical protein